MSFEFDTSAFEIMLGNMQQKVVDAAVQSVNDATDDLLTESSKLAPLDKGTLRATSWKEVNVDGSNVTGDVYYSAVENNGSGSFNYALRLHEMSAFANPTTPGTQPKFLSEPLKRNSDKYKRWFAEDIRKALSDG